MTTPYDAILLLSFGGPEGPDEVMPFLENVLRGKPVPRERMLEVAQHYQHFGGVSPINQQNRDLMAALQRELEAHGHQLRVYWGNRNWHPLLADTLRQMAQDGVRRALGLFTSAFSSYSGCRQYREDIAEAQAEIGPEAPGIDKLRVFFNHPGFIEPLAEGVKRCLAAISAERRAKTPLLFSAHSIPLTMAENCQYVAQLEEACRLIAEMVCHERWELVYQSRSGPAAQPWLEPDICDRIRELHSVEALQDLVILPVGFVSDHIEVLFDVDTEAKDLCTELDIRFHRAPTVGTHSKFVRMLRLLVEERLTDQPERLHLGTMGPSHDVCPADCCLYFPQRPPMSAKT